MADYLQQERTVVPAGSLRLERPMMGYEAQNFKRLQNLAYSYDNYNLPLFANYPDSSPDATRFAQLECFPIVGNLTVCFVIGRFINQAIGFGCLSQATKLKMFGILAGIFVLGFIPFFNVWLVYKTKPLYQCWRLFSRDVGSKGLYGGMTELNVRTISMVEAPSRERSESRAATSHLNKPIDGHASRYTTSTTTLNDARSINSKYYSRGPPPKGRTEGYDVVKHTPGAKPGPAKGDWRHNDDDDDFPRDRPGFSSFCPVSTTRNTMAESVMEPRTPMTGYRDYKRTTTADSDYDPRSTKHSFESARVSAFPDEADFLKSKYSLRQSAIDNWPLK
ncbi:hypothetical protein H4R21_004054 [Coemansia helicoidea]|uniref:Uncharacterized protein n=1 Tax=Coemansia helicoidea TaxID=1286919 RepID=A0ACC1KZV4_9FUNG|nr:hypothetical protein H4R21_004054 [Coemansia helicoidea]